MVPYWKNQGQELQCQAVLVIQAGKTMKPKPTSKAKAIKDVSMSVCSRHLTAMVCDVCIKEFLKK